MQKSIPTNDLPEQSGGASLFGVDFAVGKPYWRFQWSLVGQVEQWFRPKSLGVWKGLRVKERRISQLMLPDDDPELAVSY